jgi:hypothetical protein
MLHSAVLPALERDTKRMVWGWVLQDQSIYHYHCGNGIGTQHNQQAVNKQTGHFMFAIITG